MFVFMLELNIFDIFFAKILILQRLFFLLNYDIKYILAEWNMVKHKSYLILM